MAGPIMADKKVCSPAFRRLIRLNSPRFPPRRQRRPRKYISRPNFFRTRGAGITVETAGPRQRRRPAAGGRL